jgi:hypothetical protein
MCADPIFDLRAGREMLEPVLCPFGSEATAVRHEPGSGGSFAAAS